jgi:hypothetical protein
MLITKIIETRLDINDPKLIFTRDYNDTIAKLFKERYINKCYYSMYILELVEIIKKSSIKCKNNALDGTLYVDIECKVKGIIYEKGEIIHDCKVVRLLEDIAYCKSKYSSLQVITNGIPLSEGQVIPVIVNMQRYNISVDEISVSGVILQPDPEVVVYKCENGNSLIDWRDIEDEIKEVQLTYNELTKEAKGKEDVYKFFNELLYPYKKYYKSEKLTFADDLKNLNDNAGPLVDSNLYLFRLARLDEGHFYKGIPSKGIKYSIVTMNLIDALFSMIIGYKKDISNLLGFIRTYSDIEKVESNKLIWKSFNVKKI